MEQKSNLILICGKLGVSFANIYLYFVTSPICNPEESVFFFVAFGELLGGVTSTIYKVLEI